MASAVEHVFRFGAQGDGQQRPRALLVDGDEGSGDDMAGLLAASGLDVDVLHTPVNALTYLRGGEYSILVVDARIPRMDRLTLAQMVNAELGPRAPGIIYLTGEASRGQVAGAVRHEAVDFVSRPRDPERMMNAIGRALLRQAEGDAGMTGPVVAAPTGENSLPTAYESGTNDDGSFFATVARLSVERRLRARHFGEDVADGPAWSILLELAHAAGEHARCYVSGVAVGAGVPLTTALRHLDYLEREGWVLREPDPDDRRRVTLRLSPQALAALREYVADIAAHEC